MALLLNAGDTVSRSYSYTQPSPLHPSMPHGTGERTGNLFDYTTVESTTNATATQISGGISVSGRYYVRFRTVKFTVGNTYTMSWKANTTSGTSSPAWRFHYADNTYSSMPSNGGALIAEKEVSELLLYVSTSASCVVEFTKIMLNSGSTALPYEPYGYKIPILSGNTTTPVYLGEVETTRRVKKYECTGEENWQFYQDSVGTYGAWQFYTGSIVSGMALSSAISNIAQYGVTSSNRHNFEYGCYLVSSGTGIAFQMAGAKALLTNVAAWKTYLQQQYAAGTPVIVWYVLTTEETGIVNEPLMRIGDYADEVSNVSIPVTAGGDTLSVDTTVQPSEVTATYKGWHTVADVHERDNGQWD